MKILDDLFCNKQDALEIGFTHEAFLHGVNVWVMNPTSENVMVVCKFMPFRFYHEVCDFFIDIILSMSDSSVSYELPLKNLRLIDETKDLQE